VVYKKTCSQFMIFVSFLLGKIIIFCSYHAPLSHVKSCTPTESSLLLANSLVTVVSSPNIPGAEPYVPFPLRRSYQSISQGPRHILMFCNKASFYGEELSAPHPTPSWRTTPCQVPATAYSTYSQVQPILDVVPPSAP
jgi:hypothetical protein